MIASRTRAAAARMRRARLRRRSRLLRTGRIFGIGLSRTGTTTLTAALDQLGFRARRFHTDELTRIKGLLAQRRLSAARRAAGRVRLVRSVG